MTYIEIQTAQDSFYGRYADSEPSDLNNKNPGETVALSLYLPFSGDVLTVASGETYTVPSGEIEIYYGIDNDGTIDLNGTLISNGTVDNDGTIDNDGTLITTSNTTRIFDYQEHAGSYSTTNTLKSTYYYREFIPSTAPIDSLVVGLNPNTELTDQNVTGIWGLISSITDNRNMILNNPMVEIEITVLAEYSAYNSVSAVQTALEV